MPEDLAKVTVELAEEERQMLVYGLNQWGGPVGATESLAAVMGFSDVRDLHTGAGLRILYDISGGRALSVRDWTRALLATEIAFASAVLGAAADWGPIVGGSDSQWMDVLRNLQDKVPYDSRLLEP